MSTIKSSSEDLTLDADGGSSEIKLKINNVEKASISSAGAFTSTTIDATKLTGNLPAISGASLTSLNASNLGSGTVADARLGTVPVNKGGTGATTHTANNVLVGNGTSAIGSVAPSTSGNLLTSNGSSWASTAPAASGADTSLSNLTTSADKVIIKTWVKFRVNTGTPSIGESINVSSITDHDTGKYTINFTTAFSSAGYAVSGVATQNATADSLIACGDGGADPTSSAWLARCSNMGNSKRDPDYMFLMFVGNQ